MNGFEQEPPPQPKELKKVCLHRKKQRGHALEEDVARELAHDIGRCVIAMERMTVTLHKPLQSGAEQFELSKAFLKLTSTTKGWWQQALDAEGPNASDKALWAHWEGKAARWLDQRQRRGQRTSNSLL